LIDDSKRVNEGANGIHRTERGVRAHEVILPLADLLCGYLHEDCHSAMLREPWFDLTTILPFDAALEGSSLREKTWQGGLQESCLRLGPIRERCSSPVALPTQSSVRRKPTRDVS
jgi:hypothetical protein